MTLNNEWLIAREILERFTIDPDAKMKNGDAAWERMRYYLLAAIDNIERELDNV